MAQAQDALLALYLCIIKPPRKHVFLFAILAFILLLQARTLLVLAVIQAVCRALVVPALSAYHVQGNYFIIPQQRLATLLAHQDNFRTLQIMYAQHATHPALHALWEAVQIVSHALFLTISNL